MNGFIGKRSAAGVLGVVAMMVAVSGCDSDAASGSEPRISVVGSISHSWYRDERPILRHQNDAARRRQWVLTADGVELYELSTGEQLAQIALPDWLWVGRQFASPPAFAIGPRGEVIVSSNVVPTLWRIDPVTLVASKHDLAIEDSAGRDIGFTALAYSAQQGAYFAVSPSPGSLWRIDPQLGRAQSIPLSASLPNASGLAIPPRTPNQRVSRGVGLCVRSEQGDWTVNLAPDQRSGYVRAGQCRIS